MKPVSVAFIVPCYNEEAHLRDTVADLVASVDQAIPDYEIILIDDCSEDCTGDIAEELKRQNPKLHVIHNEKNMGCGYSYRRGVQSASKDTVIFTPGDNEISAISLREICGYRGEADMILSYPRNLAIRPWHRKTVSEGFTAIVNWIAGRKIRYYNGAALFRREAVLATSFTAHRFGYQAEILVQLLRTGATYKEVPFELNYSSKRARVFKLQNVLNLLRLLFTLALRYKFR